MRASSADEKKVRLVFFSNVGGSVVDFAALNCVFFLLSRFKVTLNRGDAMRSVIVFVSTYFAIKRCISHSKIHQFVSTKGAWKSNNHE